MRSIAKALLYCAVYHKYCSLYTGSLTDVVLQVVYQAVDMDENYLEDVKGTEY